MMASHHQSPNQLLASLAAADFEILRPDMRSISLVLGEVLVESGGLLTAV